MFRGLSAIIYIALLLRFVMQIVKISVHKLINAFGQREILKKTLKVLSKRSSVSVRYRGFCRAENSLLNEPSTNSLYHLKMPKKYGTKVAILFCATVIIDWENFYDVREDQMSFH